LDSYFGLSPDSRFTAQENVMLPLGFPGNAVDGTDDARAAG
jgi:hypothetical protein